MINSKLAVHQEWFSEFKWGECKLGNEEYGKFLSSYLRSQSHPLVLNINGGWGTGKTHFLKQLYTDLLNDHKYAVVYVNAWQSDFSNDPLLVIISELLEQLKAIHTGYSGISDSLLSNLGTFAKKGWNFSLDASVGFLAHKIEDFDSSSASGVVKHLQFEENEPKIGKSLSENYKKQMAAIQDTHKSLKAYAETLSTDKTKRKVFVLVDELDRCRPTYAIELLETIKHFFNVPNFTFVVATDTAQLSHSIKAVYGSNFDGMEYLSRFFNRTAELPEPDRALFVESILDNYKIGDKDLNQVIAEQDLLPSVLKIGGETNKLLACYIGDICSMYQLSLRKTEQALAKFQSIIAFNKEVNPNAKYDFLYLMKLIAESENPRFKGVYSFRRVTATSDGVLRVTNKVQDEVDSSSLDWEGMLFDKSYRKEQISRLDKLLLVNSNDFVFQVDKIKEENKEKLRRNERLSSTFQDLAQKLSQKEAELRRNNSPKTGLRSNYLRLHYLTKIRTFDVSLNAWCSEDYFEAVSLASKLS